ncbi:MAG: hypothetical protein M3Q76_09095 [Acidobacteriota bacterium]|nr:hypothetical protein [Acidobacteriota bacterium]
MGIGPFGVAGGLGALAVVVTPPPLPATAGGAVTGPALLLGTSFGPQLAESATAKSVNVKIANAQRALVQTLLAVVGRGFKAMVIRR